MTTLISQTVDGPCFIPRILFVDTAGSMSAIVFSFSVLVVS